MAVPQEQAPNGLIDWPPRRGSAHPLEGKTKTQDGRSGCTKKPGRKASENRSRRAPQRLIVCIALQAPSAFDHDHDAEEIDRNSSAAETDLDEVQGRHRIGQIPQTRTGSDHRQHQRQLDQEIGFWNRYAAGVFKVLEPVPAEG